MFLVARWDNAVFMVGLVFRLKSPKQGWNLTSPQKCFVVLGVEMLNCAQNSGFSLTPTWFCCHKEGWKLSPCLLLRIVYGFTPTNVETATNMYIMLTKRSSSCFTCHALAPAGLRSAHNPENVNMIWLISCFRIADITFTRAVGQSCLVVAWWMCVFFFLALFWSPPPI